MIIFYDMDYYKENDVITETHMHLVVVNNLDKQIKTPDVIFENFKSYFCESIKI